MSDTGRDSVNYCYRHPDRQSFVLCQRCGRTICPECQTQAAVGVHCPECIRESRGSAPRRRPAIVTAFRRSGDRPVVTYSIIAICFVVYIAQFILGNAFTVYIVLIPEQTARMWPWTLVTSMFAHWSILHIALNMYSLWVFGPILERALGRGRYLALYLLAGFGGSVAVILLAPGATVAGASGAIFGLLGAFFVIQRHLGGNSTQLLVVIALNLLLGFIIPNVAWQAHVGGLIVGCAIAFIYMRTRNRGQKPLQAVLVAGVGVVLVAISIAQLVLV